MHKPACEYCKTLVYYVATLSTKTCPKKAWEGLLILFLAVQSPVLYTNKGR